MNTESVLLSVDTETTGLDLYHGARPFFVTVCDDRGYQDYWQWDVDPLTRLVLAPVEDLVAISARVLNGPTLALQNSKFDVAMLRILYQDYMEQEELRGVEFRWPWSRTHDTLLMSHLLASNKPHDLTSLAVQYLGLDIEPQERALEVAVKKCRSHCQHRLKEWRIAKEGLPEMPSAGDKTWKYDAWLPRALARELNEPDDHPWYRVLAEYANADSAVTIALYRIMTQEIHRRGLWEIYDVRRKAMELGHGMEWRGLTQSYERTRELEEKYQQESETAGRECVSIANKFAYELQLPKSGMNHSLKHFCFGQDVWEEDEQKHPVWRRRDSWLDLPVVRRTESGAPSLDKVAMEEYLATLPRDSDQLRFVQHLAAKRKRDTAKTYLQGYRRFWLPWHEDGREVTDTYVLHPNLNPCGTDTLRWSSNHPNEQNISKQGMVCLYCFGDGEVMGEKCLPCEGKGVDPKSLRYCFGPAPGREWWSLDAKNIELRIPFYKAGERALIDLFERPDDPPYYGSNHLLNFHTIYPDIWEAELREVGIEKVGPHCKKKYASTWYRSCKNMGFAKQYGAQRAKVDSTAKRVGSYDKIEARFSQLAKYNKLWIDFANKHGYVETVPDKTVNPKKGYPILCTRTDNGTILPTVPLSYHVQSTAMWWTFKAMIRCQAKLDEWRTRTGFDGYICMQVHDEIVLDFPKVGNPARWIPKGEGSNSDANRKTFQSTNLWRVWVIRQLMEQGGRDIDVPTPVGVEYHPHNWGEEVTMA